MPETKNSIKYQWLSLGVILFLVSLTILLDFWLGLTYGSDATISDYIRRLGQHWPLFVLIFGLGNGMLLGHLFHFPL